jgi:uncharacterized membrane protein YdbT with pleckstrin-like domain
MTKEEFVPNLVLRQRTSRKMYLPIYAMVLILIGAAIFLQFRGIEITNIAIWAIVIFTLGSLKFTEVNRLNHFYEINPMAVVHTKGYFKRISKRIDLFAISDVDITQNFWQRILGYGDVEIHLFAEKSTLKNINNPTKFVNFLEETIRKQRKGI